MPLIRMHDFYNEYDNLDMPVKGVVVFNQDPRQLGRVKCVITGLLDEEVDTNGVAMNPERLPWIYCWQGGFSAFETKIDVPPIGATVMVEFRGSIYNAFYTGAVPSSEVMDGQHGYDYPYVKGSTDEVGNSFRTNKRTREVEYSHSSGSSIKFLRNGDVVLKSRGKIINKTFDDTTTQTLSSEDREYNLKADSANFNSEKHSVNTGLLEHNAGEVQEEISGARTTNILGGENKNIGGSHSKTVTGSSANIVGGASDDMYGLLVSRTYGLGYDEKIIVGGIIQKILAGGVNISVQLGAMSYVLTAGNYSVDVGAGNISISTKAGPASFGNLLGDISIDPLGNVTVGNKLAKAAFKVTGDVEIGNAIGKILVDPAGGVTINALPQCIIKGSQVLLGNAPIGQVLTNITSPVVDFITGAPTIGVPTVLA